jgi:hypothetical protein
MQASRKPRRTFAASLVMTIAAGPACVVSESKPAQTTPPPDPVIVANPPPPENTTPAPPPTPTQETPPAYQRNWTVTLEPNGNCLAYMDVQCKKGATCNPPPPQPVACPTGITAKAPIKIFAQANTWDCYITPPEVKCPEKTTCNPPPPRKTACPK